MLADCAAESMVDVAHTFQPGMVQKTQLTVFTLLRSARKGVSSSSGLRLPPTPSPPAPGRGAAQWQALTLPGAHVVPAASFQSSELPSSILKETRQATQ